MLSNVLEALGVACLSAFAGLIFWPAAFLPVGVYLVITALALDHVDEEEASE